MERGVHVDLTEMYLWVVHSSKRWQLSSDVSIDVIRLLYSTGRSRFSISEQA